MNSTRRNPCARTRLETIKSIRRSQSWIVNASMFDERKDGNPTTPEMSQKEKPMEKQANDGIRNSFSNGDKFLNSRFVGKEESFKKTRAYPNYN